MRIWLIALFSALLVSCSNVDNPTTYTIKAGSHEADNRSLRTVKGDVISFQFMFDSSAIYQTRLPENQYDINKLYGFREGANPLDNSNSARLGWNWKTGGTKIPIYPYVHCGGKNFGALDPEPIDSVEIGVYHKASITTSGNRYIFVVNGKQRLVERCTDAKARYLLYPYFGGQEPAPHNIKIWINRL